MEVKAKPHAKLASDLISETRNPTVGGVLAAVRVALSTTEIREFPMPNVASDCALLKMEVARICGTDVKLYAHPPSKAPVIMGHENIGYIARAGGDFTNCGDDSSITRTETLTRPIDT